jgi:hypothetical protein
MESGMGEGNVARLAVREGERPRKPKHLCDSAEAGARGDARPAKWTSGGRRERWSSLTRPKLAVRPA